MIASVYRTNLTAYTGYIQSFAAALVDRYGKDEVVSTPRNVIISNAKSKNPPHRETRTLC